MNYWSFGLASVLFEAWIIHKACPVQRYSKGDGKVVAKGGIQKTKTGKIASKKYNRGGGGIVVTTGIEPRT